MEKMFPQRVKDMEFEALLECPISGCGYDRRALYRVPVKAGSEFFMNVVWDADLGKVVDHETSKCPKCGSQLMRK